MHLKRVVIISKSFIIKSLFRNFMQIDFSSVISQYKSLTSGRNLINVIDCQNCHFSHYTANDIRISKTKKKYLILAKVDFDFLVCWFLKQIT